MADSGLRIVKVIGLVLAILTFIFVIVACVLNSWSECADWGYSSGLWFYKDKSTDMASLYEEKFIRVDQRKFLSLFTLTVHSFWLSCGNHVNNNMTIIPLRVVSTWKESGH